MARHVVEVAAEVVDLVRTALADPPAQVAAGECFHGHRQATDAAAGPAHQQQRADRRQHEHAGQHLHQSLLCHEQVAVRFQFAGVDLERAVAGDQVAAWRTRLADYVDVENTVLERVHVRLVRVPREIPIRGRHLREQRHLDGRHRRHQAVAGRAGQGRTPGAEDHQFDAEAGHLLAVAGDGAASRSGAGIDGGQRGGQRVQFTVRARFEPLLLGVVRVGREDRGLDPQEVAAHAQAEERKEDRRQPEQQRLREARRAHGALIGRPGQLNSSVNR
ncbi:MAG: hypothetical protein IPO18_11020 [bacterium]|nr:hypothetical protein [bacterium]